jgi:Spy/CpxP family protein refolding chaperone
MARWNVRVVSMAIIFLATLDGFAQENLQPFGNHQPFPQPREQTSSGLMTLHNREMLKELDLVDSQRRELMLIWYEIERTRNEKRNAVMMQFAKSVPSNHPNAGSRPGLFDPSSPFFQSAINDADTECDKLHMEKIDKVFLPHQRKRFYELQARTEFNTVMNGDTRLSLLVESLDITDEQLDKIKKTATEFNKKLEQEIARLREKRHREYWQSILTKNQMEDLETILGDPLKPLEKEMKSSDNQAVNGDLR